MGKVSTAALENASKYVAGTLSSATHSGAATTGSGWGSAMGPTGRTPTGGSPGFSVAAEFYGPFNVLMHSANLSGVIGLERSFDATNYYAVTNPETGDAITFTGNGSTVLNFNTWLEEPEFGVLYRWNITSYTSGSAVYRISQ